VLLLDQMTRIHNITRTLELAEQLSREEDWAGAIKHLLECRSLANKYKHFTAISQMSTRLADSLVMTEELLDTALARMCTQFVPEVYAKLQAAYQLLGKSQTATDQLLMHYTTAAHNTSWQVVYGHVCLMQELPRPPPYQELCTLVQAESFLPCLTDLLRSLWGILLSYYKLFCWHKLKWEEEEENSDSLTVQYNKNKLENGLIRIWQDVQSKVKQFVLGSDLSKFSIDSFLHFLDLLHKLITVGQEFLSVGGVHDAKQAKDGGSSLLQDSLVTQCSNYFSTYHNSRLEELATHLEHESWTLVPVKQSFSHSLLAEFSHISSLKSPSKSASGSVFRKYANQGTPFDIVNMVDHEEDILQGAHNNSLIDSDSEDDISEEQKKQLIEENTSSGSMGLTSLSSRSARSSLRQVTRSPATGVTVSNTGIMVLRLIGRYSHMMTVLRPIAQQVWTGICQLFQYYLYSVHLFFSSIDSEPDIYTGKSSLLLGFIYNTVILHEIVEHDVTKIVGCVREPALAHSVILDKEETLFGLSERIVGMESVIFLAGEMLSLRNNFSHQLQGETEISSFYENCVCICSELRTSVYIPAIRNNLQRDNILKLMGKVSWDLKDVVSQHSHYVDHLLDQLYMFSKHMSKLGLDIPVSKHLQKNIWEIATLVCCLIFVDGFSAAKRCTNEGRALMQLDFRQFVLKLEKLSGLKPVPHQQFVTNYIKAYYIPESELGQWVEQHTEYSAAQLRALVTTNNNNNNKTKQKLNNLINDLSDRIRR